MDSKENSCFSAIFSGDELYKEPCKEYNDENILEFRNLRIPKKGHSYEILMFGEIFQRGDNSKKKQNLLCE